MQLPGPHLSPVSKKKKKSTQKNSYISGNRTFLPQRKITKTFLKFLLLKHPEYIFKIALSKIVFSKNINFITLSGSSESSKELSKSSICLLTFFLMF